MVLYSRQSEQSEIIGWDCDRDLDFWEFILAICISGTTNLVNVSGIITHLQSICGLCFLLT